MRKASSETSWQSCTCGCKHGQTKVSERQGGAFNTGCRLHRGRLQNTRNRCVPDLAQDDNKFNKCRVQRGFEAWHMIVRRYDQRNTPDRSSAYAALISNISERDRAKDVEQFDDTLRNFINETNKYEGRFWKIRNEDKTLAVKRLMPESLLNCRFRGTTLAYEELLIALENSIMDKVTTLSVPKVQKIDTSKPMEIGMAAGTDGKETFEERYGKTSELAVHAVYKGTGAKGGWNAGKGPGSIVQTYFNSGNRQWSQTGGKKGGKEQEKGGKGDTRVCWSCGTTGHIAANCTKGSRNRSLDKGGSA